MPSVRIRARHMKDGAKRYRVLYRLGGRESTDAVRRHLRDAQGARAQGVDHRRARRAPRPRPRAARRRTGDGTDARRGVGDVARVTDRRAEQTAEDAPLRHRADLQGRADPRKHAGSTRSRSTTSPRSSPRSSTRATSARRSRSRATRSRMTLDHYAIDPNPARDERVKLPKEREAARPAAARRARRAGRRGHAAPSRSAAARDRRVRPARQRVGDRHGRRPRRAPPRDPGALDVREERPLPASSNCPTTCSRRCSRRCRHARIATSTRRCSPT